MQKDGKGVGPGTTDQLISAFKKGAITKDSLVSRSADGPWQRLGDAGILPEASGNPFINKDDSFPQVRDRGNSSKSTSGDFFSGHPDFGVSKSYASFGERFIAALIDGFILSVASAIITRLLPYFPIGMFFISMLPGVLYFIVLQERWGWTVGRKVMGMHIETADGRKPDMQMLLIRYISSILSAIILGIGYFIALSDSKTRTLHDKIAGTVVVKDRAGSMLSSR